MPHDRFHGLDPIELEVIRNALIAAAAEMDVTVWRTSRSHHRARAARLLDRRLRRARATTSRSPRASRSTSTPCRTACARSSTSFIPLEQWQDGDVVITNDPYCGGQHLPDIHAFRPVFVEGRRIAIVGTLCHHVDVGGGAAGSYDAKATEIFQEGLRIPPLKLVDKGVLNRASSR